MATKTNLNSATPLQQRQYNQNLIRQQQLANQMAYANLAQKDPYFALGNLVGNAIFSNINNRGVNKETDELSKALDGYKPDGNYQAMNSALNNIPAVPTGDATSPNAVGIGLPLPDVPNPTGQVAAPQQDPNAVALSNLAERGNIGDFNLEKFKAQYFADAQKRGRPIEQIQQAWDNMSPRIEALDKEAKKNRVNKLLTTIGGRGENFGLTDPNDLQTISDLMENNPQMATLVMQNVANRMKNDAATARQNALFAHQDATQNRLFAHQDAAQNKLLQNKIDLKGINPNGTSDKALTQYLAVDKAIGEMMKNHVDVTGNPIPPEQWSQDDQQRLSVLKQMGNSLLGTKVVQPKQQTQQQYIQPNINEYNQALVDDIGTAISTLSKKGYNKNEIQAIIKQAYAKQIKQNGGGGGYLDKILAETDWGPNGYNVKGA